ncbi:hypothetical protein EIP91_006232 [Steccherinum ochraceum]|uniref:Uncharacterized protein n=1 Tax=Steccherinum ochraceum TaxID=92696 RepID=A0A4R0RBV3_9APHY|nr:hypothetical protein EIP91_006232 [Steccherinum ochraceum]
MEIDSRKPAASVLGSLAQHSAALTSLRLKLSNGAISDSESEYTRLCAMLRETSSLQEIDLDSDFGDELWQAVASLPLLKSLKISHRDESTTPTSPAMFPALTSLELNTSMPSSVTPMIQHVQFPSLQSLTLAFPPDAISYVGKRRTRPCFAAIAEACSSAPLTHLEIKTNDSTIPLYLTRISSIVSDDVRPLLRLTRLRHVNIHPRWPWDLDDNLFTEMVHAWPDVQLLFLDPSYRWKSPSRITLQGLESVATHYHIQTLGVVLDASVPALAKEDPISFDSIPAYTQKNTSLRNLHVGSSVIDSAAYVTVFLHSLFPKLDNLQAHSGRKKEDTPTVWRDVKDFLPAARRISAQARKEVQNRGIEVQTA